MTCRVAVIAGGLTRIHRSTLWLPWTAKSWMDRSRPLKVTLLTPSMLLAMMVWTTSRRSVPGLIVNGLAEVIDEDDQEESPRFTTPQGWGVKLGVGEKVGLMVDVQVTVGDTVWVWLMVRVGLAVGLTVKVWLMVRVGLAVGLTVKVWLMVRVGE